MARVQGGWVVSFGPMVTPDCVECRRHLAPGHRARARVTFMTFHYDFIIFLPVPYCTNSRRSCSNLAMFFFPFVSRMNAYIVYFFYGLEKVSDVSLHIHALMI